MGPEYNSENIVDIWDRILSSRRVNILTKLKNSNLLQFGSLSIYYRNTSVYPSSWFAEK